MAAKEMALTLLVIFCLTTLAFSQGYMGTVSTGTGILSPLTVGSSASRGASIGSLSSQSNLTGSWSLDLKGQTVRHFDLQVLQKGDLLQGSGILTAGGATQAAALAGSVAGDRPTVFITLSAAPEIFRLELSASGTSLAGEYDSLAATGVQEAGTATGSMQLVAAKNAPSALGTGTNPSATSGAFVGALAKSQSDQGAGSSTSEKRSFYQSSGAQGTMTTSDGTTITSNY